MISIFWWSRPYPTDLETAKDHEAHVDEAGEVAQTRHEAWVFGALLRSDQSLGVSSKERTESCVVSGIVRRTIAIHEHVPKRMTTPKTERMVQHAAEECQFDHRDERTTPRVDLT